MGYKILVVEDNQSIAETIKQKLEEENFHVTISLNGKDAITEFSKFKFDLVLLDLYLPELNGEEVLRQIRRRSNVAVIIISMKSSDVEKAINLGLGADDFLTKPFSMLELLARVKAVLRRTKHEEASNEQVIYEFGDIIMNLNDFSLVKNGEPIYLTTKEFEILKLLILNPNKVFSKADIFRMVWHEDDLRNDNVINVHMRNLREKIESDHKIYSYIKTVWGFGYKIGKEVRKS